VKVKPSRGEVGALKRGVAVLVADLVRAGRERGKGSGEPEHRRRLVCKLRVLASLLKGLSELLSGGEDQLDRDLSRRDPDVACLRQLVARMGMGRERYE
jgi:hypothetical protein